MDKLGLINAFYALAEGFNKPLPKSTCKPVKKCLHCNHTHKHNNSFCSPECCKAYKEGK